MKIIYSPKFAREYRKLNFEIKAIAKKKEKVFRKTPFHPSLETHKLSGKLKDCYAFSISFSHRIIIEFCKNDIVYFHSVGSHDIYK